MNIRLTIYSIGFYFSVLFCFGFILCFPIPLSIIPETGKFVEPLLVSFIQYAGRVWFNLPSDFTAELLSDSTGLYIFILFLAILSLLIAFIFSVITRYSVNPKLKKWFIIILRYYLALILFKYGADKIFKHQFYLPEPNTLFTPVGQLSPDMLFWTSMGSSYSYTFFSGIVEIIPAILLLFRKTTLLGSLISVAVLSNVVMLNFGFDITVKIFSLFLLLISILLIVPNVQSLIDYFIVGKSAQQKESIQIFQSKNKLIRYAIVKSTIIFLILAESFSIYFIMNNFNDDLFPRPQFHGAYDVITHSQNDVILEPSLKNKERFRRVFFHRRNYFIIQTMDDHFIDFYLQLDDANHTFELYRNKKDTKADILFYQTFDDTLILTGKLNQSDITLSAIKIKIEDSPLLRKNFHWTVDSFKDLE